MLGIFTICLRLFFLMPRFEKKCLFSDKLLVLNWPYFFFNATSKHPKSIFLEWGLSWCHSNFTGVRSSEIIWHWQYHNVCDNLRNLLICYSLAMVVVEATQPWNNNLLIRRRIHGSSTLPQRARFLLFITKSYEYKMWYSKKLQHSF